MRRSNLGPGADDRAAGCLVGLLCGDSLGAQVEFQTAAAIAARPDRGPTELRGGGPHSIVAGQPTDDGELSLLLARSIALAGRPDPVLAARSYLWWYTGGFSSPRYSTPRYGWSYLNSWSGTPAEAAVPDYVPTEDEMMDDYASSWAGDEFRPPPRLNDSWRPWWGGNSRSGSLSVPFDMGGQTRSSLSRYTHDNVARAPLPRKRGSFRKSEANGALMRVAPIGIWGAGRESKRAAHAARQDAAVTHPSQVCQDASAVLCVAIARAVTRRLDPGTVHAYAWAWAGKHACQPVRDAIRDAVSLPPADFQRHQGHVLTALQNAFFCLLRDDPERALVETVRRGGDTDTNAAVCGALLGATHGLTALPARWVEVIRNCRPAVGSGATHPRPAVLWPRDADQLAIRVLRADERSVP